MIQNSVRAMIAGATFAFGMTSAALAAPVLTGTVGGLPAPTNGGSIQYESFDSLTVGLNSGSHILPSGIQITFNPSPSTGGVKVGTVEGNHAAPFLSNNGAPWGDPTVSGADTTPYISTGTIGSSVILDLPGSMLFFGLLWGSVDAYNTIEFWDEGGAGLLATYTGADVFAGANGDQGADGTYYVNINSDTAFNRVILYSSSYSFEFDNVSFSEQPAEVHETPEPGALGLLGLGLIGMGWVARRRK